ncbi:unnamed protein product [[Candida] boidinii]|uniref:Unnamed protein product n=1 Tax=Candida boidinii TaxID=5477 RepID=A0A9W6T5K9_CANBO|nr:hypothetical protein B5S30_g3811 [[Candida] boidinii]OWB84941.1 hypothetical protein B5S33_g3598 [[Candida] boidinii]GME77610.1 unnamed protein product [[Candida] boidinii]GMF97523.1 unnamed protein product [[Candida] boidinii]
MSDAQALEIFRSSSVNQDMIHHLVTVCLQVLKCESTKCVQRQLPSPPNSPPIIKNRPLPSLMTFITKLVRYTNVYTGTLMATIVYLNRLKTRLPKDSQGLPDTRHRIFLACLIISSKYHNDSSPKNKHWTRYTDGLFKRDDVNLMERQLLMLLDWDLRIETDELTRVWKRFLDPIKSDLRKQSKMRNSSNKNMTSCASQEINSSSSSACNTLTATTAMVPNQLPTLLSVSNSNSYQCNLQIAQPQNYTHINSHSRSSSSNTSSSIYTSNSPSCMVTSPLNNNNNTISNAAPAIAKTPSDFYLTPSYTRSSSVLSMDSSYDSIHSRVSSVSSISSASSTNDLSRNTYKHHNQPQQQKSYQPKHDIYKISAYGESSANILALTSSSTNTGSYTVDPIINSVALKEEQELHNLIRQYCGNQA